MLKLINKTVDLCYIKPFHFISKETFSYAFAGGLNVAYGIVQYWFIYNFILGQQDVNLGLVVVSAPIMTFLINFAITFFTGFYLVRGVAFAKSHQHTPAIQMLFYAGVVAVNVVVNYVGIKVLVEQLQFYPTIANALVQVVTIAISFTLNKFVTFRGSK